MKLPLLPKGVALKLSQNDNVLGGSIWPAASAMCHFLLDHHRSLPLATSEVIELGSGTGAVGIFAAGLGFRVHLTEYKPPSAAAMPFVPYNSDGSWDFDENLSSKSDCLLQLLAKNVAENQDIFSSSCYPQIHELDWTRVDHVERTLEKSRDLEGFDYVFGSDVTYFTNLHEDLATTISRLLKKKQKDDKDMLDWPKCFVAHQKRMLSSQGRDYQLESFEQAIDKAGMTILSRNLEYSLRNSGDVIILEIQHQ